MQKNQDLEEKNTNTTVSIPVTFNPLIEILETPIPKDFLQKIKSTKKFIKHEIDKRLGDNIKEGMAINVHCVLWDLKEDSSNPNLRFESVITDEKGDNFSVIDFVKDNQIYSNRI